MVVSQLLQPALDLASLVYMVASILLTAYALHAYGILAVLARHGARSRLAVRKTEADGVRLLSGSGRWPAVVTQLPIYNEVNVASRVIRAAASMDYPGEHTVQILDDSTDETRDVVDQVAGELRAAGKDVRVVRRQDREGFKAGALAHGMGLVDSEFLAVFDADFVPPKDFLTRTVPLLAGEAGVGFVQGRWTFLNERASVLTRAQGVGLDSHFVIEQSARSSHPSMLMNFNGTAGIWRREAIVAAGGWSAATLTEDLDLSYRVQLVGWRGQYLNNLEVPGELPSTFAAYKSQQFRWAKGSMQTAIRLLPILLKSDLPVEAKLEAFFHLTHYAVHPLMLLVVALAPLLVIAGGGENWLPGVTAWALLLAAFAPTIFYSVGQALLHGDWPRRLLRLPALTLAGMGVAASNTRAVWEAFLGKPSAFIRTPKRGENETHRYQVRFPVPPEIEFGIGVYALWGFFEARQAGMAGMAQFCILAAASFFYMGCWSLVEKYRQNVCEADADKATGGVPLLTVGGLRGDGLEVLKGTILDPEYDNRLSGSPSVCEGNRAGDSGEVLDGSQGGAEGLRVL
ncbi:MAG: hypothetical protein Fur0032_12950 [Terrimicrobiaceae bacterium]